MDNNYSPFVSSGDSESIALTELTNTILRAEISSDHIIPDRISDADAVLLCTAIPRFDGQFITDTAVEIEGSMTYHILLATENNSLSCLTLTEPFDVKSNVAGINSHCQFLIIPQMEYATARLLNPRKLNLRSQVNLALRVFDPVTTATEVIGAETLDDEMNLQRSLHTFSTMTLTTVEEKKIPVSYDIELDSSAPPAAEIVSATLRLFPMEVRLRGQDADIRARVTVTLLYRTEENNYFPQEKTFEIDKTLSLPSSDGGEWQITLTPNDLKTNIAANAYGEQKVIELDFTYDMILSLLSNRSVSLVKDMFSTEFECEPERETLQSIQIGRAYCSGLTVSTSAQREEVNASEVRSVFGGNVILKEASARYDSSKGKLIIEGAAQISLIGERSTLDPSDPLYLPISLQTPFRCELDCTEELSEAELLLNCDITDIKLRTDPSQIHTDFELSCRILALSKQQFPYVRSLRLDRTAPIDRSAAPITLCYPSGRESLWDIAKYYKITPENIAAVNALNDGSIEGKKVLLIPRVEPKRAVFSKVI